MLAAVGGGAAAAAVWVERRTAEADAAAAAENQRAIRVGMLRCFCGPAARVAAVVRAELGTGPRRSSAPGSLPSPPPLPRPAPGWAIVRSRRPSVDLPGTLWLTYRCRQLLLWRRELLRPSPPRPITRGRGGEYMYREWLEFPQSLPAPAPQGFWSWFGGLVDGDGHLCLYGTGHRRYPRLEITQGVGGVGQLVYAHGIISAGAIHVRRKRKPDGSPAGPYYSLVVGQHAAMRYLVCRLGPHIHNPTVGSSWRWWLLI